MTSERLTNVLVYAWAMRIESLPHRIERCELVVAWTRKRAA